jgi:hypothetical protein
MQTECSADLFSLAHPLKKRRDICAGQPYHAPKARLSGGTEQGHELVWQSQRET